MTCIKYFSLILIFFITLPLVAEEEASTDPGARTWSHVDGRKIKAGIVDANSDKVTLRAPNGKTGGIALEDLSKDDQEYVKNGLRIMPSPRGLESQTAS